MASTIFEILQNLSNQTVNFVPSLVGAVILLIIGLVVGKIVGRVVKEVLEKAKIDFYITEKEKPAVSISHIFGVVTRWWIYLAFIAAAVDVLQIRALTVWVTRTVDFIPNIIGATIVLVAAYMLAEYIKVHLNKMKSPYALMTGKIMFFFVMYVAVAIALPILGISALLVNNILLITIASVGLGMAIALGLGLKDSVADVSKKYVQKLKL